MEPGGCGWTPDLQEWSERTAFRQVGGFLGVKGSQVQILSSRRVSLQGVPVAVSALDNDTDSDSDTLTVSVGVLTVMVDNAGPTAVPDGPVSTPTDTSVLVDVLGTDTDPDGGALSVVSVTQPAHGSVAIMDTRLVYTPEAGYTGTVTVTYVLSDGQGGTTTGTVTLDVVAAAAGAATPSGPALRGTGRHRATGRGRRPRCTPGCGTHWTCAGRSAGSRRLRGLGRPTAPLPAARPPLRHAAWRCTRWSPR